MPAYTAPIDDLRFVLHDMLAVETDDTPGYDALDPDTTGAILTEAGKLATELLAPLNPTGDATGCRFDNGVVRTPPGFAEAYRRLSADGWMALDADPDHGGQGMPYVLNIAVNEMFVAANIALNTYQGLTHGAYAALRAHGTAAQKAIFLPPLATGRWAGTMNLTEPQCGTDLGLIRTRAVPNGDGTYALTGQKIWITGGEHDMTENIVHLVLARLPDAPAGVKGISLFVVPKVLVDDDGRLGARNGVSCGGLEAKMGQHGSATCVMNYDAAIGTLVGEPHKGLRAMFTMMNEARVGVGLQGYAQAARAYGIAADFARDRLQGRALGAHANPDGPADPIIVHPDVRRGLMDQKSFVEGARAFALWGATLIDRAARAGDAEADRLVSLLTPVIKGFLTDKGFETAVAAQQTLGGAGYVRDWEVEQIVRDARIAMIYEGTNGIQALDLVGRKLPAEGGRAMMAFLALVDGVAAEDTGDAAFKADFLDPLAAATADLRGAVTYFLKHGMTAPEHALAGAHDFLHLMGHVCLGLMWTRMAQAALAAGAGPATDARLATGRHYMARRLPETATLRARIEAGAGTVMSLDPDAF